MPYRVYAIQNGDGRFYIGLSDDVVRRINQHNVGDSRWTRGKGPWRLICQSEEMNLSDAHWELCGTHPALGTVTLRELLATWVVHDLGHVAQIARVMSKQYSDTVGPWKAYLPVLNR